MNEYESLEKQKIEMEERQYIRDLRKMMVERANKVREIDWEVNGPLVEIANFLGTPILARLPKDSDKDPELFKHRVNELRALIKDVNFPDED